MSRANTNTETRETQGLDRSSNLPLLLPCPGSWRRVVAQCDTNVIFRPRSPAIHSEEANLALCLVCAALSEPSGGEGALGSAGSARATYSYTGISWVGGTDGTLYCSRPSYKCYIGVGKSNLCRPSQNVLFGEGPLHNGRAGASRVYNRLRGSYIMMGSSLGFGSYYRILIEPTSCVVCAVIRLTRLL